MLRSFYNTRVLIDFDAFENSLEDGVVICTSMGILNVIRVLIRSYGLREANWVTAYSSAGYISPSEEQIDLIDSEISAFLGETNDMTFCDDLTQALNNLAAAFEAGCCGEGSFGAGQDEPPASTNTDDEEDWPPGFDTYAEYRAYKCDIANRLIQGLQDDIDWLGAGTITTLVASGLVASLFTPIPFDDILLLVGFVVSLLLQGVLAGTALAVSDEIDNQRQTLVCLLYDAVTAETAKSSVYSYMDSLLTSTEMALFSALWTFASVNALFDKTLLLEASPLSGAVPCTTCSTECELCVPAITRPDWYGIFTEVSETVITMTAGYKPIAWRGNCHFNTDPDDMAIFCGPPVTIESYDLVGFNPSANGYRIYDSDDSLVYEDNVPPIWANYTDVRHVYLISTTDFSGTITLASP